MIKQIVQHSAQLVEFIVLLQLNLAKPQYRHVLNIADTVIVCEAPHKTLTTLYDLLVDAPDASNAADCLRISPINDIFEETHKVTEWFFSTNPFNFPTSFPKIEDYYPKDDDQTSFHSISSIKIGGGYIHEEKTMDIYESRVKIFSTYARHTNNYFGDNEKFKLVFAKDPLDKNTNRKNRKEDKDNGSG